MYILKEATYLCQRCAWMIPAIILSFFHVSYPGNSSWSFSVEVTEIVNCVGRKMFSILRKELVSRGYFCNEKQNQFNLTDSTFTRISHFRSSQSETILLNVENNVIAKTLQKRFNGLVCRNQKIYITELILRRDNLQKICSEVFHTRSYLTS